MELRELLRRLGRRLWVLAIVPLVAVAVVAAMAAQDPPKYTATATVAVSAPSGQDGASSVTQAVSSLTSAVKSRGVLTNVSEQTNVPVATLQSGIDTARVGTSELVDVTYTGTDKAAVAAVIETLPKVAQESLYSSSLGQAKESSDLAQKAYDAALARVEAVQEETGLLLPDQEFQAKASEVTQLRVALVTAQTRPDTQTTGPLTKALTAAEKALATLAAKVRAFDQPEYALERARASLAAAQSDLLEVQARQANAESTIQVSEVAEVASGTDIVRRSVSAAIIGLAIAVLLLVLSELLKRSSRGSDDELEQVLVTRADKRRTISA